MSSGLYLNGFADFVAATGSTYVGGPKRLINAASENTYWLSRFLKGESAMKKVLQGGKSIKANIFFEGNGTGRWYLPGATQSWDNPQRLKAVEANWRYSIVHMSWVEQEILLNDVITKGTADHQYHQFAELRNEKEAIMWTEKWKLLEDAVWAQPNRLTMEGDTGDQSVPYSVLAFVNEYTNGMWGNGLSSEAGAWTSGTHTIEGIDPAAADTNGNFVPQQVTYGSSTANDLDNPISRFDEIFMDLGFEQPPTFQQYFEDNRFNKFVIATTKEGRRLIMNLLRQGQDHFVAGPQDPAYPDPQFHGIPITRAAGLETVAGYAGSGGAANTAVTEGNADATAIGPRFYWLNTSALFPVFHSDMYFEKREPTKHHNVPDTWVCPVMTWMNMFCPNRRKNGVVYPNADISGTYSVA